MRALPGVPQPRCRQCPPAAAGEDKSALIPLTTSTPRFVLNVHFYWCSPCAKMCLIT